MTFEEWQESEFSGGLGGGRSIARKAWQACEAAMREQGYCHPAMCRDENLWREEMARQRATILNQVADKLKYYGHSANLCDEIRTLNDQPAKEVYDKNDELLDISLLARYTNVVTSYARNEDSEIGRELLRLQDEILHRLKSAHGGGVPSL